MSKGKDVINSFYNAINKMIWLNNNIMKERLEGFTPAEIHCIEYIDENEKTNVTSLSDAFLMTTGGITKLTKKLIEKNCIESYKLRGNKKEVYFKLTDHGNEIYEIHKQLHNEFDIRDQAIFSQLSDKDYGKMIDFANQYEEHLQREIEKRNLDQSEMDKF